MEFTGERVTPACRLNNRELFLWHMARYDYAGKYIRNLDRVLDVACGTGYGTFELSMICREVMGIDISAEAIGFANVNYQAENILWREYDCTRMTDILAESSFDAVVSFETIEHLDRDGQSQFVDQISRVLKQNGLAIISTPNVDIYGKSSHLFGKGSYHQYEMNKAEFLSILKKRFGQVYLLGQAFSDTAKYRWRSMKLASIVNGIFHLNFKPIVRDYEDYMDKSDFDFSIYNLDRALMLVAICRYPVKE
jgi:2-polyprenyl-3-methyl-5-hydroxy-6-metoxy-1,4-benzoquinol methylase